MNASRISCVRVAALGGMGATLGMWARAPLAVDGGMLSAALSARYLRRVTAPHDGFESAFGPDWQARIPPARHARMQRQRGAPFALSSPRARWTQDVVYATMPGTSRRLLCDVWQPPRDVAPTGLGLIYLHGGAWQSFDKDHFTRPFFHELTGQGHVAKDVSYRMCPETNMYGIVTDVKRAIVWLKAHAARHGVDPARVVVAGGSAGGHLALLMAYTPNHPALDLNGADTTVRAVVSYYGLPDLRRRGIEATKPSRNPLIPLGRKPGLLDHDEYFEPDELAQRLFGGTPAEVPQVAALMSPLTHVGPHCPPTLLLQGLHNHITSVDDVRALQRTLEAAGVPVVYVPLSVVEHAFDLCLPRVSPSVQAALYDMERFLAVV